MTFLTQDAFPQKTDSAWFWTIIGFLALWSFILYGCDDNATNNASVNSPVGSAMFRLVITPPDAQTDLNNVDAAVLMQSAAVTADGSIDCEADNIATIACEVYNADGHV